MSPDNLTDLACSRIADLIDRMSFLSSKGNYQDAVILSDEVYHMTQALDNNDPFLVICYPDELTV